MTKCETLINKLPERKRSLLSGLLTELAGKYLRETDDGECPYYWTTKDWQLFVATDNEDAERLLAEKVRNAYTYYQGALR